MKLAFCLFKYFPYGGLQRDFLRIAELCVKQGHEVIVYTMDWQGDKPNYLTIKLIPTQGYTNHARAVNFSNFIRSELEQADLVVGFNKMPGLDLYYCADSCYLAKVAEQKSKYIKLFYNLTSRYKTYKYLEDSVFNKAHKTKILFLAEQEQKKYQKVYQTDDTRCHLLPPNINKTRFQPITDVTVLCQIKQDICAELSLDTSKDILLMVGSGFKTKGVDRSIKLIKYLIENNKDVYLIIIGQDNPNSFIKLAEKLNIKADIRFLPGRDDIDKFMAVAKLLVHPAYRENTGTVLLESIIMGLPVVASGICGYAKYIASSGCGRVIPEPFSQNDFESQVLDLLALDKLNYTELKHMGYNFREQADIYNADSKILEVLANA